MKFHSVIVNSQTGSRAELITFGGDQGHSDTFVTLIHYPTSTISTAPGHKREAHLSDMMEGLVQYCFNFSANIPSRVRGDYRSVVHIRLFGLRPYESRSDPR